MGVDLNGRPLGNKRRSVGRVDVGETHSGPNRIRHAIDSKGAPRFPIAVHCYQVPNPGGVDQLKRFDMALGAVALRVDVTKTESLEISACLCHADQNLGIDGRPGKRSADPGRPWSHAGWRSDRPP